MNIKFHAVRNLLALAIIPLAACHNQQASQSAPPPPAVTVSRPVAREVRDWDDYGGRLQSPETANVTARVSGFIEEVPFVEGTLVKKGEVLFVMDERPFQTDLDNKKSAVQKDEAQSTLTKTQLQRSADLLKNKTIAQQDYDTSKAQADQATAQLAADKAAEEASRLNLEWSRVVAPISGRISRMYVTAGNQVTGGTGDATLLTTIVSVDPIHCYISVPGSAFLRYQQLAGHDRHDGAQQARIPCKIGLETETDFPHEGTIDFIDNAVDPNTGTIQMRGVIPNPTGQLTPGVYARLRLARGEPYKALLVPDKAVGAEQNERYLLIVGADNVVASRTVKTGALFGSLRAILSGLDPNDRVVVNGLQKAQPGAKVSPKEEPIPAEASGTARAETSSGQSASGGAAVP